MVTRYQEKAEAFFLSPFFMLICVAVGWFGIFGGDDAVMPSLTVNGLLFGLALLFCRHFSCGMMPYLSVIAVGGQLMSKWTDILPYLPWGIPIAVCLVYHFVRYPKKIQCGHSYRGVLAAALAIMLGGLFSADKSEMLNPAAIYHYLGLSILLLVLYLVYAADYKMQDAEQAQEHFLWCVLFMGVLCAAIVFKNGLVWWENRGNTSFYNNWFASRNTIANLLLMCIPVPFYFAKKQGRAYSRLFCFLLGLCFYIASLFTTARTALVFGTVLVVLCLGYFYYGKRDIPFKLVTALVSVAFLAVALSLFCDLLLDIIPTKYDDAFTLYKPNEARVKLFFQSLADFAARPLFGVGIAPVNDILKNPMGCIRWYHLYFPQIWGSMGLFGCFAYLYQGYLRYQLATYRPTAKSAALVLCYVGLFLYSQTDPGVFITLPFGHFAVILFILLEGRYEKDLSHSPLVKGRGFLSGYLDEVKSLK